MDEKIKKQLIENIKEFYETALKEEEIPTNHSERFRILETKYPEIYKMLDESFPFYQDSYKIKLNKEICQILKNDTKRLIKILKISL